LLLSSGTSLYFTLISFTTIGFGDVLPTNRQYMMLIALLLLIGLALVSTVISVIQEQIASLSIVTVLSIFCKPDHVLLL